MRLADLFSLARDTVLPPRNGAERLLRLDPPPEMRWIGLFIVAAISAIFAYLVNMIFPLRVDATMAPIFVSPLQLALAQLGSTVVIAALITAIGRAFGGSGRFEDGLLLLVWLGFILLIVQAVQIVVMFVFPILAGLLNILAIALFLWLLPHFVALQHGFRRIGLVALGMAASFAGLVILFALVLAFLGYNLSLEV